MKLTRRTSFYLSPAAPFHFDGTFHKPSHFPDELDIWTPGQYWQALRVGRKIFGLKIENQGKLWQPKIKISVYAARKVSPADLQFVRHEITWRFNLDEDLLEFNKLIKQDKKFAPVFKKWLGMRNATSDSLYELLIVAIVLQNATVHRSVQMLSALLRAYGTTVKFDRREVYAMWLPERLHTVSEQKLRSLKLGYRAKFIKRLSADLAAGKVDEFALRDQEKEIVKKELVKLYGVGPETARILLFECFHRYGSFDHIAPWQQKIYSRLFYDKKLVPVKKIQKDIRARYGSYAELAVHYIWEDIFWRRRHEHIPWLEQEIRL